VPAMVSVRAVGVHVDGAEEDGRNIQQSSSTEWEACGSGRHDPTDWRCHGLS